MENKKSFNPYRTFFVIALILSIVKGYFLFSTQHQQINSLTDHVRDLKEKEGELNELKVFVKEQEEELISFRKLVEVLENQIERQLCLKNFIKNEKVDYSKIYADTHLYEITGKGLSVPSYLYGVSPIKSSDFELPKEVIKATERADTLLMSIDYDEQELLERNTAIINFLLESHDKMDIKPIHTEAFFTYLKEYQGTPSVRFMRFDLDNIACLLNEEVQYEAELIYNCFSEKEKNIKALQVADESEALSATSKALNDLSIMKNILSFLSYYEKISSFRKEQKKVYKRLILYKPELEIYLMIANEITTYNKQLLPDIETHLKTEALFIALDTQNLLGYGGLPAQLLKKGYTIHRIQEDGSKEEVTLKNIDIMSQCFS